MGIYEVIHYRNKAVLQPPSAFAFSLTSEVLIKQLQLQFHHTLLVFKSVLSSLSSGLKLMTSSNFSVSFNSFSAGYIAALSVFYSNQYLLNNPFAYLNL